MSDTFDHEYEAFSRSDEGEDFPRLFSCKYCGTENLHWSRTGKNLVDDKSQIHRCQEYINHINNIRRKEMESTVYFRYSEEAAKTDKARLLSFHIKDKVADDDFYVFFRGGHKKRVSELPKDFEIRIWFPKSVIVNEDVSRIISVTESFSNQVFAKIVKPENSSADLLFMYVKKLWTGTCYEEMVLKANPELMKEMERQGVSASEAAEALRKALANSDSDIEINTGDNFDSILSLDETEKEIEEKKNEPDPDYDVADELEDQKSIATRNEPAPKKRKTKGCSNC